MSEEKRSPWRPNKPGPYLAIVKNHLDNGYMGSLEVAILKGTLDNTDEYPGAYVPVRYLSPFTGSTSVAYEGDYNQNSRGEDWKQVQKSYGFWMVPPDVGSTVLVIFIEGEYSMGYWIGCVQDKYQNYMIPGLAAQELSSSWLSTEQIKKYGTGVTYLPVAEMNKKDAVKNNVAANVSTIKKPVFTPFADQLALQGLLTDRIRGVTSSSARREHPSQVYGISTPGPKDKSANAKIGNIKYAGRTAATFVGRLGGTQFVMDDGDENGDNELVRIRTRTGHQILLHNTSDLIYIANSKGTAWIELTSKGKIDIFAQDSISIHTEKDFNVKAGGNVNIEAQNDIQMHSFHDIRMETENDLQALIKQNTKFTGLGKVSITSIKDNIELASDNKILFSPTSELHLSSKTVKILGSDTVDILGKAVKIAAGDGGINLASSSIKASAKIKDNSKSGPSIATLADRASPETASTIQKYGHPSTNLGIGWANDKFYYAGTVQSITTRVPMHEPWIGHEAAPPSSSYTGPTTDATETAAENTTNSTTPDLPTDADAALNCIQFVDGEYGTGDKKHFSQMGQKNAAAYNAVLSLAYEYNKRSGKKLIITSSYRSDDEQLRIYNAWVAAGGNATTNPVAAGLYIPVKPTPGSPDVHSQGRAIDVNPAQAETLEKYPVGASTVNLLAKFKLYRPVPAKDPGHIVYQGG
jgi:hypothetical protein